MAKEQISWGSDWMDGHLTSGVDIVAGEFIVVSCEGADQARYQPVAALLERIRNALLLDVLFLAQWANGRPVTRYADEEGLAEGESDPLEATYGGMLLETRPTVSSTVPGALGSLALPVVGRTGCYHGTLCCRVDVDPARFGGRTQHEALQSVARLVASALDDVQPSMPGELLACEAPMPSASRFAALG